MLTYLDDSRIATQLNSNSYFILILLFAHSMYEVVCSLCKYIREKRTWARRKIYDCSRQDGNIKIRGSRPARWIIRLLVSSSVFPAKLGVYARLVAREKNTTRQIKRSHNRGLLPSALYAAWKFHSSASRNTARHKTASLPDVFRRDIDDKKRGREEKIIGGGGGDALLGLRLLMSKRPRKENKLFVIYFRTPFLRKLIRDALKPFRKCTRKFYHRYFIPKC